MNQILYEHDKKIDEKVKNVLEEATPMLQENTFIESNAKRNKLYKTIFFSSLILLAFFIVLLLIRLYKINENEEISKRLTSSYSISTLYTNNNNNNVNYSTTYSSTAPFVIGIIKIDKINLNYSILSISNKDLLDISVCRFAGPMPNEVGNLCIAGHNYNSYKFFSKLKDLKIGDIINIYDLSGNKLAYSVYDSFETNYDDLSCINQDTNGKREITLITCNNIKNRRRVIKATEKV